MELITWHQMRGDSAAGQRAGEAETMPVRRLAPQAA